MFWVSLSVAIVFRDDINWPILKLRFHFNFIGASFANQQQNQQSYLGPSSTQNELGQIHGSTRMVHIPPGI